MNVWGSNSSLLLQVAAVVYATSLKQSGSPGAKGHLHVQNNKEPRDMQSLVQKKHRCCFEPSGLSFP